MPLDALPDVFLPYQQELWRTIDAARVTVVEKSRRTGYSWTVAAVAASYAALKLSDGGMDTLYMGYDKDMTREFIDYVAEWAKVFQIAASAVEESVFADPDHPEREITSFRIKFGSGCEVIALPSVARVLRGKQGLVVLDEAAFVDDLDEVLKAAFALLIWGGKVAVISTHNGEVNPFNALVTDIRAGKRRYRLLRLTFDEAVAQGLYRRICLKKGWEWTAEGEAAWRQEILDEYADNADEELNVIPNAGSGTYLPGPLIEARMRDGLPVLRLERTTEFTMWPEHMREANIKAWIAENLDPVLKTLDLTLPYCFGFDFARKGDLSVFMPAALGRDLVRRVPFILEMRNVPFGQQRQVLWHIIETVKLWRAGKMDATGNGSETAELTMQRFGAWIEPVMLNEPWYRENMPPLKAAFEDAMLELPRDRDVLDDFRALKLVRGVARVPERGAGDDGKKRHADAAIAGVLMYAASRAEAEFYDYAAASTRRVAGATDTGWRDRPDTWAEDHPTPGRGIFPTLRGGMLPGRRV